MGSISTVNSEPTGYCQVTFCDFGRQRTSANLGRARSETCRVYSAKVGVLNPVQLYITVPLLCRPSLGGALDPNLVNRLRLVLSGGGLGLSFLLFRFSVLVLLSGGVRGAGFGVWFLTGVVTSPLVLDVEGALGLPQLGDWMSSKGLTTIT